MVVSKCVPCEPSHPEAWAFRDAQGTLITPVDGTIIALREMGLLGKIKLPVNMKMKCNFKRNALNNFQFGIFYRVLIGCIYFISCSVWLYEWLQDFF